MSAFLWSRFGRRARRALAALTQEWFQGNDLHDFVNREFRCRFVEDWRVKQAFTLLFVREGDRDRVTTFIESVWLETSRPAQACLAFARVQACNFLSGR